MSQENVPTPKNLPHILTSASTLLGICFLILCSVNALGDADKTLLDEIAGASTILFLVASILSYASMRSERRAIIYEKIADFAFLAGLIVLASVSVILVFGLIH